MNRIFQNRERSDAGPLKAGRNPPKTQQTEYAKGAKIFFNAEMSNDTGQKYYRINKGNKGITPEFKILDPSGTEIASKTMEYG